MVDKLRLEVILSAVDRVTGPLKKIIQGSKATAQAMGEAELAIKKMEAQQRKIQRLKDAMPALGQERNALRVAQTNLAGLQASGNATTKQIAAQAKAVEKQSAAYERQRNVVLRLRSEVSAMGLGNASQAQQKLAASVAVTNAKLAVQRSQLEQQRKIEERLANLRERHGQQMGRLAMAGAGAAAGMHVGKRMVQSGLAPVDSFMQHEDAMMGVVRQVNGARDDAGQLTEVYRKAEAEIRALSTRIPQTTVQIAEMYTAAARMEVPTDKLAEFVQLSSDMATAFDAVPDVLAESMGKIANNLKIPVTEMRGMADAINYLDDNAISKGADIVGFLNRVGGVAGTVGISGKDMAALGSTLLTSGETEETAGTSVKAIFTNFAAATKGTKRFKGAVAEIGMTPEKMQEGMATDAVATLQRVAEAIQKLPKKDQLGVMAELAGKEHVGRLAKLVTNTEELRRQIALANSDGAKGSMAREAGARNSALSAQLQMAKNRLFNATAIGGETLKAAILELLTAVNPLIERLSQWMQKNPGLAGGVLKVVIALGALIAVVGGVGMGIVALLGPMMLARFVLSKWLLQLLATRLAAGAAGSAMGLFARLSGIAGRVFSGLLPTLFSVGRGILMLGRFLLATPLGIALALIATAAYLIWRNWDGIKGGLLAIWQQLSGAVSAWWASTAAGAAALWQDLVALKDRFFSAGADLMSGLMNGITSRLAAVREAVVGAADSVGAWFREKLGIASPSRVFMEYGGWISEGAALGITGGQSAVRNAALAMATAATLAMPMTASASALQLDTRPPLGAPMQAGAAGRGGATYNITINAAPGMDAQAIARAVSSELDRRDRAGRSRVLSQLSDID